MASAQTRPTSDLGQGPLTQLKVIAEVDSGVDLLNTQVSVELSSALNGQTVEDIMVAVQLLKKLIERYPGPGGLALAEETRPLLENRPVKRRSKPPASPEGSASEPPRPVAELVPVADGREGKPFRLRPLTVLGRSKVCDFAVSNAKVSRQHSKLMVEGDGYVIEDLGSANFTWVNGEKVERPQRLTDGDIISLGDVSLQYRILPTALQVGS